MFTRCSHCRTVFHITAAELRAADGAVICGACGETFDALESLSETLPKEAPQWVAPPAPADAPAVADPGAGQSGETADFARDEEEFLEELEALIGDEAAPDVPDDAEEFLVEDLDAGLEEAPSRFDAALVADQPAATTEPDEPADDSPPLGPSAGGAADQWHYDDPDEDIPDPDSVFRVDELDSAFGSEPETGMLEHYVGADEDSVDAAGAAPGPDVDAPPRAGEREHEDEHDDHDEDEDEDENKGEPHGHARTEPRISAVEEDEPVPEFAREPSRRSTWVRLLLALLALLVLGGTWAHTQHGKLLRHPLGEALLGPVYSLFGIAAVPDWSPAAFRAVQWEAIADPNQPDHLTVAVDFTNTAAYAQPYPIIRIMLEDRFGRRIGTHDIPPEQYLGERPGASRLPANGRFRTTLVVPDPGGRADGFRVDFCLELQSRGLVCGPEPFR